MDFYDIEKTMSRNLKKTTLWNLSFQYYSILYSITLGLLLVPIYVKHIPLNIYGAWLASGNLVLWLTYLDPGVSDVLKLKVLESYAKKDFSKLSDLLFSGLIILLFISLLIIGLGFIISIYLKYFINEVDLNNFSIILKSFYLAILGSSLLIFSFGLSSFNQGMLSSIGVGIIYVISTTVSLFISVYLLKNNYGLISIPLGQIICGIFLIIGNIIYIIYRFKSEVIPLVFSLYNVKKLFSLSSVNFLGKIGGIVSNQIDALLISKFIGTNIVPSYILTKKGPEISRTFIERPLLAFLPSITSLWYAENYDKLNFYIIRLFKLLIWILGIVFIGFVLSNNFFITLWVGSKFYTSPFTNFLICLNLVLLVVNSVFTNIYFSLGNIKITSRFIFYQSIITGISLFIGIKYWGINGLLIFQFISYLVFTSWILPVKVFKLLKIPNYVTKSILKEILLVAISCIVLFFLFRDQNITNNWLHFIIYIAKIVGLYFTIVFIFSNSLRIEVKNAITELSKIKK
jgi:O-antigen/teichoic acid export membrane protein